MLNKDNTCIIFGCSPFINKINKADINYLIENYYHIGLNNFVCAYPNVNTILFSDYGVYDTIKDFVLDKNIIISQTAYHHNFELDNREKPKNIEYIFDARSEIFHDLSKNILCMYKTCAHPAINYAYLKGYKNIILCGIDLSSNWVHFDIGNKTYPNINRPQNRIQKMRDILYRFKDYINLYQLNPLSNLDIKKINIGEL